MISQMKLRPGILRDQVIHGATTAPLPELSSSVGLVLRGPHMECAKDVSTGLVLTVAAWALTLIRLDMAPDISRVHRTLYK